MSIVTGNPPAERQAALNEAELGSVPATGNLQPEGRTAPAVFGRADGHAGADLGSAPFESSGGRAAGVQGDGTNSTTADSQGHGQSQDRSGGYQHPLTKAPTKYVTFDEAIKALDAIIVAIGIVAVLIVNVAYVGYLTLPGGPDQYWATCDYPALTAYVCLNGFALVFALAAIVAVTYGPLVLIRRERPDTTWRPRVVNIGLFHLTLSLVTLLAAFACAGFVVALVGAPEPKCANVLCSEGGVPCSAFSVSLTGVSIKGTVFPYVQRTLSPEVAKLNNSTFGNPAGPVFCQDYTYIARFQPFAWQHPHLILNQSGTACEHCECPGMEDARYSVITNPCFGVFSMSTFGNASLSEKYHDDELGTDLPKPNAYAMWCTTGSQGLFAPVAGGWLPIMLNRTAALLGVSAANLTSNGAVSGACSSPGYTVDRSSPCSGFPSFNSSAGSNINGSIPAVHMLHGVSNPWLHQALGSKGSINNSYLNPSDGAVQSVVCPYALNMGWDGRGVLSCPKSDPASGVNYANCKVPDNSYNCSSWPLYPAYYYAALQYQCSSLVNGTLCDFGVSPPYAVDEDGNYLQRTQATSRGSFIVSLVPNPITGKIWPVIVTMLVVAVAANVLTFSILGCFEWGRMQRCWGRCMGYLIARPSKVD